MQRFYLCEYFVNFNTIILGLKEYNDWVKTTIQVVYIYMHSRSLRFQNLQGIIFKLRYIFGYSLCYMIS